jgi:hypothetical protein
MIDKDSRYVDVQKHNAVNITKSILIGIKNTGNAYLTNCRVYFEATDKDAVDSQKWLRVDAFSLNPDEERLVSLAMYGEPISSEQAGLDRIGLAAPLAEIFGDLQRYPRTVVLSPSLLRHSRARHARHFVRCGRRQVS